MEFSHIPVLLNEAVDALEVKPDGTYIDGTAGGGGHSAKILERLGPNGRLISIDQDPTAIKAVKKRFGDDNRSVIVKSNFSQMARIAYDLGLKGVDGVLLDIGVSSPQLDTPERGFSYHSDAPLDMRMSQTGRTAADLVNELDAGELADIIFRYGEEKFARSIASGIVKARESERIETTLELAEIISRCVPAAKRRDGHPARKTFQALRIAVNGELQRLEEGLDSAFSILSPGGRLAVITFHSLEDRITKQKMASWCKGCTCPKDFPVCVCGNKPKGRLVFRKPLEPSLEELDKNPRSRSAKLRCFEKM